jgi:hypothetical protein
MGIFESLMGRSKAPRPNLDRLFLVPSAAITLQTALGLTPTGDGSVCFRAPAGAAYQMVERDVLALLGADPKAPPVTTQEDSFGFTWLVTRGEAGPDGPAVDDLCTDLHAVNTILEEQDFAGGLLCTLVVFADPAGHRVGLVYLYKQGTFYAFAPTGPQSRDNLLELQVRDALAAELPMERELSRWLAVWGAPGLS